MYAQDMCVKIEGVSATASRRVCRPVNSGAQPCPGGMTRCFTPSVNGGFITPTGQASRCTDTPGRWATRKCAKKLSKGKCSKRKVRTNCAGTCGHCSGR